jgi:hypothetical protein
MVAIHCFLAGVEAAEALGASSDDIWDVLVKVFAVVDHAELVHSVLYKIIKLKPYWK